MNIFKRIFPPPNFLDNLNTSSMQAQCVKAIEEGRGWLTMFVGLGIIILIKSIMPNTAYHEDKCSSIVGKQS